MFLGEAAKISFEIYLHENTCCLIDLQLWILLVYLWKNILENLDFSVHAEK